MSRRRRRYTLRPELRLAAGLYLAAIAGATIYALTH